MHFKNSYTQYPRDVFHSTIRADLLEQLRIISAIKKEPKSKCMDVILNMVLNDEKLKREFENKLRLYK